MHNIRDPQDVARSEPAVIIEQRAKPSGASSYVIPSVVLVLFLIGGILLAGSVPSGPQVGQEIQRPTAPTSTVPAAARQ